MHDEMLIKADLVFDPRSGELVGFVNPDDNREELATHVLVFYIVGLNSKLSVSLGFFPTKAASADQLYPKLWQAIGLLELVCGLKVS